MIYDLQSYVSHKLYAKGFFDSNFNPADIDKISILDEIA